METKSELSDFKLEIPPSRCEIYINPTAQEKITPDDDIVLTIKILRNGEIVCNGTDGLNVLIEHLEAKHRDIPADTTKPREPVFTLCLPEGETIESARKNGLLDKTVSAPRINQTDQPFNFKYWIVSKLPHIFNTN